jgi:hypothetical protein
MSVPRELQMPGRTRSMDAELQSERWDFTITVALILPLFWVAFGFAQTGQYVNCAAVALPAAGFLVRSIIRFSNV